MTVENDVGRESRQRLRHHGASRSGRHGQQVADRRRVVLLQSQQHRGRRRPRIEQRDRDVEQRPRRPFGEIPRLEAAWMRPRRILLRVGLSITVRIAAGAVIAGTRRRVQAELPLPRVRQIVGVGVRRHRGGVLIDERVCHAVVVAQHQIRVVGTEGDELSRRRNGGRDTAFGTALPLHAAKTKTDANRVVGDRDPGRRRRTRRWCRPGPGWSRPTGRRRTVRRR